MGNTPAACNAEQTNLGFLEASQYMNPFIANKSLEVPSIYRNMIPRSSFPKGQGYVLQKHRFYGGQHIQDAGSSWNEVQQSRPAGTLSEQDAGWDACRYQSEVIGYGFETLAHRLYEMSRRTEDICLKDIEFFWQFEKQLELLFEMLANVTIGEWEQFGRETYISFCTKYLAAEGLPTFTMGAYADKIAIPAGGLQQIGPLQQDMLDTLYQYLCRQSKRGAIAMDGEMPVFGIVTSPESSTEMVKHDPKLWEAYLYASPEVLIEGYGAVKKVQHWAHIHDTMTPRFKVDWNASDGWHLARVFPFRTTPTSIRDLTDIDPEYVNAPFEMSVVFLKDVFQFLIPDPNPSSVGAHQFDPASYMGDFDWFNIQERCENLYKEKGFFHARFSASPEPMINSDDCVSILHRRCATGPYRICTPCGTGVTGSTDAVAVTTCAGAVDADEITVTLADCLACDVGQQVKITFTDTSEERMAMIVSSGEAPTYILQLGEVPAEGTSWCDFDGGAATVECDDTP